MPVTEDAPENERQGDRGREARSREESVDGVSKFVRANPQGSIVATAVVSIFMSLGGSQFVQGRHAPEASSGQMVEVLEKVKALTEKVDGLAGDVRSFKDNEVVSRLHAFEAFMIEQRESNRERSEARRDWAEWRKATDANAKLVDARLAALTGPR